MAAERGDWWEIQMADLRGLIWADSRAEKRVGKKVLQLADSRAVKWAVWRAEMRAVWRVA